MLNPQWLLTFEHLAALGNFTRTAERLDLTQAAVSQHIRHLEERLGPLLIRRPRQIELTPAGHALLDYCGELQRADQRLRQRLDETRADEGDISLISPGSIGLVLYPLLLDLQQANPGLVVRHRFAPDSEVLAAVLDNRFELGLVSLRPDDARLEARLFAEEPLELVLPAGEQARDWGDLQRLGMIDHPDGQAMAGRLLSRCFPDHPGLHSLPLRGFSNQVGLILEPVARGLGFAVLPRYARQAFANQAAIQVAELEAQVVDRLWLIHRAEWPLSSRAERAIEHLQRGLAALP
ncbi:LysR family transcriptional regulator [Metapseudomonas otitidis]|uniref:LysR family transcriptional regulator n=1 Tax=Metapseudomonas otitidis TaxID=319939 RepID=UPI003EDF4FDA